MYIYACPVQQLLIYYFQPHLTPTTLFLFSLIITLPLAVASWRFIEGPCLRLIQTRRKQQRPPRLGDFRLPGSESCPENGKAALVAPGEARDEESKAFTGVGSPRPHTQSR
jgi:hypothetical protein